MFEWIICKLVDSKQQNELLSCLFLSKAPLKEHCYSIKITQNAAKPNNSKEVKLKFKLKN